MYFSCPQPQACMNIYLLGEESHCRLMYCCIYHIWEKNVPAFTEGHLNISPLWKIRNFQVFYMDLLGMCLSLSWVVESLQFLLPLDNVQDPNTPGCIGSFRWLKLVSVERLWVHCIAQIPMCTCKHIACEENLFLDLLSSFVSFPRDACGFVSTCITSRRKHIPDALSSENLGWRWEIKQRRPLHPGIIKPLGSHD